MSLPAKKSSDRIAIGQRVYLRAPQVKDWPEYSTLTRRSSRLFRGLLSPLKSELHFSEYVRRCQNDDYLGLLICRIEDDAIAGTINVSQICRANFQNACLGYSIGEPFANQGYMTEAMQLVLHLVFAELDLHRLEANIQPVNTPSIALVKRAGFRKEGFSPRYLKVCGKWCDHERWAILAEDWRAIRKARHAKSR